METVTVTVSPKFQVVIPLRVRQSLGIKPGQKVQVILYDGRIELIPLKPVEEMRGFLQGINTAVEREAELEDMEDAEEIRRLRKAGEETIPWEQAKAELRAGGVDA